MNGISLAALLGAATWFGSKFTKKAADSALAEAEPVASIPDSDSDGIDYEDDRSEFIWPPGPMYQ